MFARTARRISTSKGFSLGTVGGLAVDHTFPLDGEYQFSLELFRTNLEAIRGLEAPHQIEMSVDGRRIFLGTVGGDAEREGAGRLSITDRSDAIDARLRVRVPVDGWHAPGRARRSSGRLAQARSACARFSAARPVTYDSTGRPHIETLTIAGPFNPTGAGDTAESAPDLLVPSPETTSASRREACATKILSTLARRAFRRPVTKADTDLLLRFYRTGLEKRGFDAGIQMALRRILASPTFIFRVEEDPANVADGATYRISDVELASRLSFFLWSSIPDDTLLDLAVEEPPAERRRCSSSRCAGCSPIRAPTRCGRILPVSGCTSGTCGTSLPNHDEFPDFDDTLPRRLPRGDGAVLRQHHAARIATSSIC